MSLSTTILSHRKACIRKDISWQLLCLGTRYKGTLYVCMKTYSSLNAPSPGTQPLRINVHTILQTQLQLLNKHSKQAHLFLKHSVYGTEGRIPKPVLKPSYFYKWWESFLKYLMIALFRLPVSHHSHIIYKFRCSYTVQRSQVACGSFNILVALCGSLSVLKFQEIPRLVTRKMRLRDTIKPSA